MSISPSRVSAVIFGQAIGDSLGLPVEHRSAGEVHDFAKTTDSFWPRAYVETIRKEHTWKAGEWSDDTDQALCILDAYLENPAQDVDPLVVASNFLKWAATNGRGIGKHTGAVFAHPDFSSDPFKASKEVWEASGQQAAPNGAVMRTSYVGVLRPWDLVWTAKTAADCARVTHYDPRCVASAVAVSVAIACLCQGQTLPNAMARAMQYSSVHHDVNDEITESTLKTLNLDEGLPQIPGGPSPAIGYTGKTLGAGFYASRSYFGMRLLRNTDCEKFRSALTDIIFAGGDTDTNAAVAGAMLGAQGDMICLPSVLLEPLQPKEELAKRIVALLATYPQ